MNETDDSDLTTAKESGDNVLGCTYASADNYNLSATVDDGSCSYENALADEYDEGYEDGYDDGSLGNDYYWDCTWNDGLTGIGSNALADFSEESFESAWSEQPGSPDWCGTEFNYDSLEMGESVMPALEDEVPEYFHWYVLDMEQDFQGGVGARSDHYYWDDFYTESECEDINGVWKSINGHDFCGEYLDWLEVERDANLIYEYDADSGEAWWGKYEIIGDYMYIADTAPLSSEGGYDEGYDDGWYEGYDEGYSDGWYEGYLEGYDNGGDGGSTLDAIIDRGYMMCGVKTSQFGMGYLDDDGTYSGLDIEYCRAIAAAIGLDPDMDIEYVLATGSNRFELLASGDVDVLIRTTTWTTSRDADLNADFAGINFYDGQGMLVNLDAHAGATSIMDLDGVTVCVGSGTTTEGNLADYFLVNNLEYTAVNSADADSAKASFTNGECTAWTGDMSAMVAQKYGLEQGGADFDMAIMPELMSKEPLAAATRDNDDDWNDVVTWVWYGMLTAEELGIDSSNYGDADLSNPSLNRLLNSNLGLGTAANPLSATWMQSVLATSGNYYEAYDRSFCDGAGTMSNCLIDRAGTANAPWWEGGLQYAPPMR